MRQEERRARTIRLLVDEAARSVASRGYEGTTLEAVAAGVGLSKGAVYAHFPTKLDLLLAMFEEALAEADRRVRYAADALAAGASVQAASEAYFRDESTATHAGIMAEAWRLALAEPALFHRVQRHREQRLAILATGAIDGGASPGDAMTQADLVARLIDAEVVERRLTMVAAGPVTA